MPTNWPSSVTGSMNWTGGCAGPTWAGPRKRCPAARRVTLRFPDGGGRHVHVIEGRRWASRNPDGAQPRSGPGRSPTRHGDLHGVLIGSAALPHQFFTARLAAPLDFPDDRSGRCRAATPTPAWCRHRCGSLSPAALAGIWPLRRAVQGGGPTGRPCRTHQRHRRLITAYLINRR